MKYRKWDSKTEAELCNRHQITQSTYYYWLKEFETKSHKVFESLKESKKEQRLKNENKNLKRIIAELSIELKKTEIELQGEDL